jgi:hypothetical protein
MGSRPGVEMSFAARRAVLLASLAWVAACGSSGSRQQVTVNGQANGTTVVVPLGQTLVVELRNAGDGGFLDWVLDPAPASTVLRLAQESHRLRSRDAMPGNFGRDIFEFDTVNAGTTLLGMTATRPWSGETLTYTLDVVVR